MHVNLEHILDLNREILDFSFIVKHYTRKWDFKYSIKEPVKPSIIESLAFSS